MVELSIVIPHMRKEANNMSLSINIDMLMRNTYHPFELIIDTESPKDPYKIWNEVSTQARGKILVFTNSDVIFAKDWDVFMVKYMQDNAILTGYLIEPGNIGVASENIHRDFGKTPYTFRYNEFQSFCDMHAASVPECREERGWYMPCAFLKDWFVWTKGFDTELSFPNPNDILFWNKMTMNYGTKLLRVRSYAYHFQNLSSR